MRSIKRIILLLLTGFFGYLSMYYATGAANNSVGDRTNSPFGSGTCGSAGCHSGGSFSPILSIQLMNGTTPVNSYIPGASYTVVITTTSTTGIGTNTRYGFQVVSVNGTSNANVNGWGVLPAGTHATTVSSRTYIEQSAPLSSNTVTIPWTAPVVGTGAVNFYVSCAIVNFDGSVMGDNTASTLLLIDEGCNAPVIAATHTDVSCFGGNNGSISITAGGGSPPYTYSWTGPGFTSSSQNISGLVAGTYTVTVMGGNCSSASSIVVSQPTISTTHTNVSCNGGSNATAGVTVNGLPPPYTYSWSGSSFSSPSQSVAGLSAGMYSVSVSTGSGCTISGIVAITQPNLLMVATSGTIACTGQSFTLSANASGGASPYNYSWSGPNGFTSTLQHPVITNTVYASAGTYTVLVTDTNGCTKTGVYSVVVNTTPNYSIAPTPVSCNNTNDGSVSISVGGASQYTFLWSGPNGFSSTGLNIASLVPGTYTIVVTTGSGCTITASAVVTQPLGIAASSSSNSPVCIGRPIALIGSGHGGTGNYSYSWAGPNGFTSSSASPVISPATIAEAGNYTLTVSDVNQCANSSTVNVSVSPGPTLSSTVTDLVCNGTPTGAINLSVGGVPPGYICTWAGPNGYTASSQNITGLAAGTYTVDVNVPGGCIDHLSANVTQPAPFQISTFTNSPVCNGGSLSLAGAATGGAGGLSYSWTGPNGFSYTGQSTSIHPLSYSNGGNYVFSVRDATNCIGTSIAPVTIDTIPVPVVAPVNVLCNGSNNGAISVTATGGGPFIYLWSGPGGFVSNVQNISNLAPGTYTVVATSALGCVGLASGIIHDAPVITTSASSNGPVCGGGALRLTANATGGTGTFTYAWTGPNSFSANQQNPVISPVSVAASGTYHLNATDANNCVSTVALPVSVISAPVFNFTVVNERCFGGANGSITLAAIGGLPPFSYQWSGPAGFTNTSQNINNLLPGAYQLTISGSGCQAVYNDTVVVTQPLLLKDSVVASTICAGTPLGLTAIVTGGTPPYAYSWSGPSAYTAHTAGPVITLATPANAGTYSLAITDANNCTATGSASATVLSAPQVHLGNDTDICKGNSMILDAGNTGNKTLWSTGDTTQRIRVFVAAAYSATVTDSIGCSGADTILVRVDSALHIDAIGATNTNNTFTFVPINPVGVNSYQWYFGDDSTARGQVANHTYAATGKYTVTLIGSNACGSDTLVINIQVDSLTGVAQITAGNSDVHIFPNPARERINIISTHPIKQVRIASATGNIVYQNNDANAGRYSIDASGFASGLYIVYIDTGATILVSKVAIVR